MGREPPWWKCPGRRAANPVWSALSLAARGLLATFDDAGDNEGFFALPPGGLDAYVVSVAGPKGAKIARAALAELEAGGWFTVEGGAVVLHRHPAPRGAAPTVRPLDAEQVRQLRHRFNHRERMFRDLPPGLTWVDYVETPEGIAALQGHPPRPPSATLTAPTATPPATPLQRPLATHETIRNEGTQGVAGVADREKREDTHTARAHTHAREGEEPSDEVDPAEIIATINQRSQGRLNLKTYGDDEALRVFHEAVIAAVADGTDVRLILSIGDHAAHGGFDWRTTKRMAFGILARELPKTLEEVETCPTCSGQITAHDADPWEHARRSSRVLCRAFIDGADGRIVGASSRVHEAVDEQIRAAGIGPKTAHILGAFACEPKRWARDRAIARDRPPTLQELVRFDGAALAECIVAFRAVRERERAAEAGRALITERDRVEAENKAAQAAREKAERDAAVAGCPRLAALVAASRWIRDVRGVDDASVAEAVLVSEGVDVTAAEALGGAWRAHSRDVPGVSLVPSLAELAADDGAPLRRIVARWKGAQHAAG